MSFVSLEFIIFLILVFLVYWKLTKKYQNIFLLVASYVFYGWWDWRFLFLIFGLSTIIFFLGQKIHHTEERKKRRMYLIFCIAIGLGILSFFKYFNFFVDSFKNLFLALGAESFSFNTLNIILPIGISFYTFQIISYAIDVYWRKIPASDNFIEFLAFASFFPQLLAGPINRASSLLPQFAQGRIFKTETAVDGCRQILWGFFKKIVIADALVFAVNSAYKDVSVVSGGQLLIATFFFAFQLYCDFSGYSDIAIGTGKLFGFKLMRNFNYPYFSKSIAEFWRRWHISLSTWLRDYLYYPLVFGRKNKTKTWIYLSTFVTFTLIGLWHGAGWNFIFMGVLFSFYIILGMVLKDFKKKIMQFFRTEKL